MRKITPFQAATVLATLMMVVGFSGRAAVTGSEPQAAQVTDDEIDIVVKGTVYKGRVVLPCTETEFSFKIKGLDNPSTFRWAALEEYERKRVQKLYGLEIVDGTRQVFGEKLPGERLKLKTGKSIEGLRVADKETPGKRVLRTATMLMTFYESEIEASTPIDCYESDFFSAREVYERRMLEQPPGPTDAAANLKMSTWCANIQLYAQAIEHLEKAKIIDPRTEERNTDFRAELVKRHANKQAVDLFDMMSRELRAEDGFSALEHLEQFDREFTNTDIKSRVDVIRPTIIELASKEINKRIVTMSYRVGMDLVQRKLMTKLRIDEKGNIVPSIPGKQVTTKQGHVFKGILTMVAGNAVESQPDPYEVKEGIAQPRTPAGQQGTKAPKMEDIALKMGDTTINIAGRDILTMVDCDLSVATKTAEPTYDELKSYVVDADGLKREMCQKISKFVKIPASEVQKVFDGRLAKVYDYKDGDMKGTANYASFHDADYGIASWFRPGAPKPMKYIKPNNNKDPQQSSRSRFGGGNMRQQAQNLLNGQDEEETAESTDDPAVWWKFQNNATRLKYLTALAAEKVFKLQSDSKLSCPTCGNKGVLGINQPGGNDMTQRCPTCRGSGVLYKIIYH